MLALWKLSMIPPEKWELMRVGDIADRDVLRIWPEYLVTEAMPLCRPFGSAPNRCESRSSALPRSLPRTSWTRE
jgi:hypothetical protein